MREDIASQTSITQYNNNNIKKKNMNMEKLINWNDAGETDRNIIKDGMENMDEEV